MFAILTSVLLYAISMTDTEMCANSVIVAAGLRLNLKFYAFPLV